MHHQSKIQHSNLPVLADSFPDKYLFDSKPENFQIKQKGLMIHIPHIQPELIFPTLLIRFAHG